MIYFKLPNLIKNTVIASSIAVIAMTYSFAEVTLMVEDNIKVTSINNNAVNTGYFKPVQTMFKLNPGRHVINAKYDRLFKLRSDDHDFVKSSNVTLEVNLEDNQTYTLVMPGQPENYQQAKAYANNPTLAVTKGSQTIAQKTGASNSSSGLLAGLTGLFGGNSSDKGSNDTPIAATNTTYSNTNAPVNTNGGNANALDSFMQIWLQATPDERAKIRQWVSQ